MWLIDHLRKPGLTLIAAFAVSCNALWCAPFPVPSWPFPAAMKHSIRNSTYHSSMPGSLFFVSFFKKLQTSRPCTHFHVQTVALPEACRPSTEGLLLTSWVAPISSAHCHNAPQDVCHHVSPWQQELTTEQFVGQLLFLCRYQFSFSTVAPPFVTKNIQFSSILIDHP